MRISDWSSDVCSSDLNVFLVDDDMISAVQVYVDTVEGIRNDIPDADEYIEKRLDLSFVRPDMFGTGDYKIGRASCRERGVSVRVDLGGRRIIKKKKNNNQLYHDYSQYRDTT